MKINKILDNLYKVILIFSIICLSIALIGAIFLYINYSKDHLNWIVLLFGTILYLLIIIKLYKYIIKLSKKKKNIIAIILLILQFIVLFISFFIITSVPKVDLMHILIEINNLKSNNTLLNNRYFSIYPNNRFILMYLYVISLIPVNNQILFNIVSSLSITISSLFTYKTVYKISNQDKGLLSLFICVLSPILYLYVSYYYTDVLMLPFASILIYLLVIFNDNKTSKNNIIYGILIGIISIIGYKIRAVCIFPLIGYIVYYFINRKKIVISKIIPVFISLIITYSGINMVEHRFFPNINKNMEFPMTHWVMMGVNNDKNGRYNAEDYKFSRNELNKDNRKKKNIDVIKKRLKKQGIKNNLNLFQKKLLIVWGSGDYAYQKYLDLVKDYNKSYSYLLEDKNIAINYVLQITKIAILFLTIISLIILLKSNTKSFVSIAIFGAIIFYLFWEASPRYGLSFLPWLIILSSYSYDSLNININKIPYIKYIKYSLFALTIIIFAVNFSTYTKPIYRNDLISKSSTKKIKYIKLDKDKYITQTLKLNNNFNRIKLKFKVDKETDSTYKLELIKNNKVEYKKEFTDEGINNRRYTTFNLDKTYKKGIYTLRISSLSKSESKIVLSYNKSYDYYPEGILKINDKEEEGDLMFQVIYHHKRSVYSITEYVIMFIVCIVIEYIVLFRKRREVYE